jgi:acyl-coenzyme A thioesterase PaaI-like protein
MRAMSWDEHLEHTWSPGDELPSHNDGCMICGAASASSPLVEPFRVLEGREVGASARFDDRHQGAPFYAHGGVVAAVLDDACGYVSYLVLRMFVTAHLEVDYRRPVVLGETYAVRARCVGIDGRKVHLAADLLDDEGLVAESRGLFVTVDIDHFRP